MPTLVPYATVTPIFKGQTLACIGTGPSLTQADVECLRGHARVIVVNDAVRLAPWADVLYAADAKWFKWHKGVPNFAGLKFTIEPQSHAWPGLQMLRNTGRHGLERDLSGLRTGSNSGYQSIGLAVHLGAARIILLGFDMKGDHFFGSHRDKSKPPFAACLEAFKTLVQPLADRGVEIVNCTPDSALRCFPMASLHDVLQERAA